jgi:hypothetical protein
MTSNSVPLPNVLQEFIDSIQWTFAETMPEWPHEYIDRDQVDDSLFMMLVQHIRWQGYESKFYQTSFTYYDYIAEWFTGRWANRLEKQRSLTDAGKRTHMRAVG